MGVEPTNDRANLPPAGFEDREDHRTPCASEKQFLVSGFWLQEKSTVAIL